ncbi:unnamed protein product [Lathyrus sativus]|nr:unnamed protein product [Lathyrus sativus]
MTCISKPFNGTIFHTHSSHLPRHHISQFQPCLPSSVVYSFSSTVAHFSFSSFLVSSFFYSFSQSHSAPRDASISHHPTSFLLFLKTKSSFVSSSISISLPLSQCAISLIPQSL